jgi:hypothetical protein
MALLESGNKQAVCKDFVSREVFGVRTGLLPIALAGASAGGDLERAELFVDSLRRHWKDQRDFQLIIVTRAQDVEKIRRTLSSDKNVSITIHSEEEFFAANSRLFNLPGWWKQQIIKLRVPVIMRLGAYFTFDSDVICIDDIDSTTFVSAGRLLSQWEPQSCQQWWQNIADLLEASYDESQYGLSVTPNLLHIDLSRQALKYISDDPEKAIELLCEWHGRDQERVSWTEYSLYTSVALIEENMFEYHVPPEAAMAMPSGVRLHSQHNVWDKKDYKRLLNARELLPDGKFLIVQSTADVPVDKLRADLNAYW